MMHPENHHHTAHVEAWLARAAGDSAAPELIAVLERALLAMWDGAKVTLGEITLTAIVDRVLFTTTESHPFVSIAKIDGTPTRFEVHLRGDIQSVHRLREVVRFVLVEFLTVLGNLTDEILTPALNAALTRVGREESQLQGPPNQANDGDAEGGAQ